MAEVVLRARGLRRSFGSRRRQVVAVDGVDVEVAAGATHALVGESGSGKSTLARLLTRLMTPDAGQIDLCGEPFLPLRGGRLRRARASIQMVFQDPRSSLDPRLTALQSVSAPLASQRRCGRAERGERAAAMLEQVGLATERHGAVPQRLSGGECQRVAIARALVLDPAVVVLDEPVSALDSSIRVQILSLLSELQAEHGTGYLMISHDLATVAHFADVVSVMFEGRIVETGPTEDVLWRPEHAYTRSLIDASI